MRSLAQRYADGPGSALLLQHDDPTDAADDMLEAALENGGRDNVTIIVLNVHRTFDGAPSPAED